MKKFAGIFILLVLTAIPAVAQDAPSQDTPPQDSGAQPSQQPAPEAGQAEKKPKVIERYSPRYEVSAGFDHRPYTVNGGPHVGMNGWYGSFDYNWKTWLGFVGEAQGVYTTLHPIQAGVEKPSMYLAMAGPQFYPLRHHFVTPFGHFLYGGGYYREMIGTYSGFPSVVVTDTTRAWELGGGLDVRIHHTHWSVRAIQFDYGNTNFKKLSDKGQGSYRVSFGVVYSWGER
ncbi:MAG TPA: hypothetical protein VMB02_16220 [Candidatus Aquilonibacter sp.]|nr:hypothetical protein [Candidatus Aquilonibacter sp.]